MSNDNGNVVSLAEVKSAGIVDYLEDMLDRAKAGEIAAIGVALIRYDNSKATFWTQAADVAFAPELCAAAHVLAFRLTRAIAPSEDEEV